MQSHINNFGSSSLKLPHLEAILIGCPSLTKGEGLIFLTSCRAEKLKPVLKISLKSEFWLTDITCIFAHDLKLSMLTNHNCNGIWTLQGYSFIVSVLF